jgi:hypothetical protein
MSNLAAVLMDVGGTLWSELPSVMPPERLRAERERRL